MLLIASCCVDVSDDTNMKQRLLLADVVEKVLAEASCVNSLDLE
jgi:hypothetical protein